MSWLQLHKIIRTINDIAYTIILYTITVSLSQFIKIQTDIVSMRSGLTFHTSIVAHVRLSTVPKRRSSNSVNSPHAIRRGLL